MDVRTLCLGILTLGDASGYEIRKQFEEGPLAYFYGAGFGAIYPALKSLNRDGMVEYTRITQKGHPPKNIYSITPKGLELFRESLAASPAPDMIRSQTIMMFFFNQFMEEEHLDKVYDEYVERSHQTIEKIRNSDLQVAKSGCKFTSGLGLAIYEAIIQYMEDNRSILFNRFEE